MQDREQDRLGGRLEEPLEELERRLDAPLADGIGERPDRARDGLGDERADVVGTDRLPCPGRAPACRAPSRRSASAGDARRRPPGRSHRPARRGAWTRPGASVSPRSRASASIQPASAPPFGERNWRIVPPAAATASASRLGDRRLRPGLARVEDDQRVAGRDQRHRGEERVAILVLDDQRPGVLDDGQRPAAEHDRRGDPLVEVGQLPGRDVAVAAQDPAFERRPALGGECRLEPIDRARGRQLVVAPEEGERDGRHRSSASGRASCMWRAAASAAPVQRSRRTSSGVTPAARQTSASSRAARARMAR